MYVFIYLYICTNKLKLWPITANNLVFAFILRFSQDNYILYVHEVILREC